MTSRTAARGDRSFAALGSGPDDEHEGREISRDAGIRVKAHELR